MHSALVSIRDRLAKWLEPPVPMTLRTQRLLLRDLEDDDEAAMRAYLCDPMVLPYLNRNSAYSRAEIMGLLMCSRAQMWRHPRRYLNLGIVVEPEGALIGECGLARLTWRRDEAFLGFLLRSDYWGRGYATEAVRAVIDLGFRDMGLETIHGGCLPINERSARVMEKVGMRQAGRRRGFPGSPPGTESLVFSLARADWRPSSEPPSGQGVEGQRNDEVLQEADGSRGR